MPKYIVKSPLDHDQERFEIGAEIELSGKQAEPLLGHTVELKAARADAKKAEPDALVRAKE